ncbi:MAG: hypothetical protein WC026_06850 [Hyphomicrobium sp.]|uniref:hypothetical protein n=1 Tax=Hyphomicrobium sp. TaxID=82 RepID=UPI00356957B2
MSLLRLERVTRPSRARESLVFRCIVALMLSILTGSAAMAGALRHCVAQDGHHAIEFTHAGNVAHTLPSASFPAKLHAAVTVVQPGSLFCIDHLLFVEVLKPSSKIASQRHLPPMMPTLALITVKPPPAQQAALSLALRPHQKTFADPGLIARRTVVLLN